MGGRIGVVTAGLATGVLAAVSTLAGPAQAGEVLDRIRDKGVLVMSTDPEYPPQSSINADNDFEGFDIDVGRAIADRLGVRIKFVTPGWDVITAGRWAGRWDMSVGSMTPTAERKQVLDFPAIYYYTPAALVVHADNDSIAAAGDVSGKRIGVGVATTYENYLKRDLVIDADGAPAFSYQIDKPDIRTYDTDTLALQDLRLGDGTRLDAVITALPTALEARDSGFPIRIVGNALFLEPLAVAIDKGDAEFGERIALIVEAMRKDGTLRRLSEKWYSADLTGQ